MRRERQKADGIVHTSNLDVSSLDATAGGMVGSSWKRPEYDVGAANESGANEEDGGNGPQKRSNGANGDQRRRPVEVAAPSSIGRHVDRPPSLTSVAYVAPFPRSVTSVLFVSSGAI